MSALVMFGLIFNTAGMLRAEDAPALFLIRQNGKYGYINAVGKVVIEPRFQRGEVQDGRHFQASLQAVWVNGKAGYIDASGKMVIAPQFDLARPFSEGLAPAREGEKPWKWGYIDKAGHWQIPPQFDDAYGFSESIAQVVVSGHQVGYIDKSGAFRIPAQLRAYAPQHSSFAEGFACVETNGKWGFIDTQGKVVIEARLGVASMFHDGLAVADIGEKEARRSGFIDKSGAFAIEPQFLIAWQFSEGLARVRGKAGVMQFIDKTGHVVFDVPRGQWAGEFSEGLVNIQLHDDKWGYVDQSGKWAIEPRFHWAEPFYKGLAKVAVDNKIGYINRDGHFVWGPDSGNEPQQQNLIPNKN